MSELTSVLILSGGIVLVMAGALGIALRRMRGKAPPGLSNAPVGEDKLSRIKRYRDQHPGATLKQAKDAIEADEGTALGAPLATASLQDVQTLVAAGRVIDAIKLYRSQTGVGLKEAKEAVERLRKT